jgi:hypothetical protein
MVNRISLNLNVDDKVTRKKGDKVSTFLITINPNINIKPEDLKTDKAKDLIKRLMKVGNYFTDEKNIKKALVFKNKKDEPRTKAEHLASIIKIENSEGSVEYGRTSHRLHLHFMTEIHHRTILHLNKDVMLKKIASDLKLPADSIHFNIRAQGNNNFLNYVRKYNSINKSLHDHMSSNK